MERLPVATPAFVYDEARLEADCRRVARLARRCDCRLLYSVKALSAAGPLTVIRRHVDGFSVSSRFENLLVQNLFGPETPVHMTSPGLQVSDVAARAGPSHYLSCNSIPQLERLAPVLDRRAKLGIRVNPGISLAADPRFDPSRPHSKLGAAAAGLAAALERTGLGGRVTGLLVHNNCDADDFSGLLSTVDVLRDLLSGGLPHIDWVNLGGGYTFRSEDRFGAFVEAIARLRTVRDLTIFIEPGAALVRGGVSLVASVVDLFDSGGEHIAVLDTAVNHMPEILEYQDLEDSEPWVAGHVDDGAHAYTLAGASCLAGDLFGSYRFAHPLAVGDQIVFPEMGAYAFVKAHWFNGVNLPSVYARAPNGSLTLRQQFTFDNFLRQNGAAEGDLDASSRPGI